MAVSKLEFTSGEILFQAEFSRDLTVVKDVQFRSLLENFLDLNSLTPVKKFLFEAVSSVFSFEYEGKDQRKILIVSQSGLSTITSAHGWADDELRKMMIFRVACFVGNGAFGLTKLEITAV